MASTSIRTSIRSSNLRWLLVPAVVGLFALLGLAASTEDREEFEAGLGDNAQPVAPADGSTDVGAAQPPNPEVNVSEPPPEPAEATPETTVPDAEDPDPLDGQTERDRQQDTEPDDAESAPALDQDESGPGEQVSFEIRSELGAVGVQLVGDADAPPMAIPRSAAGAEGTRRALEDTGGPDGSPLRLRSDGELEPLGPASIGAGEFALGAAPGGVDLRSADGTKIEFRVEGDGPDFTITGVDANGVTAPLRPDPSGTIDVGDGVTVQVHVEPEPSSLWEQATTPWRWFVVANTILVILSLAWAYYLHRTRPLVAVGPGLDSAFGHRSGSFDDFLAELLDDDDPARAIRLAFETAECGLGTLPARLATETPFEWHSRVSARQAWLADDLSSLCSRFATARFAPDRPTPADRDAAVAELQSLAVLAGHRPSSESGSLALTGRS